MKPYESNAGGCKLVVIFKTEHFRKPLEKQLQGEIKVYHLYQRDQHLNQSHLSGTSYTLLVLIHTPILTQQVSGANSETKLPLTTLHEPVFKCTPTKPKSI